MFAPERVYRTADDTLVREGHPDAVVLAYGEGDPVENRDADEVGALFEERPKKAPASSKKAPAPRNKKAPEPDSK